MDRIRLVEFLCLLVSLRFHASHGGLMDGRRIAGPVDIILKKFEMCPKKMAGEDGMHFSDIHYFNPKDRPWEFVLSANVTQRFYLDDSITADLSMAQWSHRGGWKMGAHNMKFPGMCSSLSTYAGKIWEPFVVQVYGKNMPCPLPPLEHGYVRNVTINSKFLNLKEFIYGRWRCDVIMVHAPTQVTKGCMRFTSDIAPALGST